MLKLIEQADGVRLAVKIVPGASRDRIVGELGGALKIAVAAAPQRGAANRAVIHLLAEALGIHPSNITIARGTTSPRKELLIRGLGARQVLDALCKTG